MLARLSPEILASIIDFLSCNLPIKQPTDLAKWVNNFENTEYWKLRYQKKLLTDWKPIQQSSNWKAEYLRLLENNIVFKTSTIGLSKIDNCKLLGVNRTLPKEAIELSIIELYIEDIDYKCRMPAVNLDNLQFMTGLTQLTISVKSLNKIPDISALINLQYLQISNTNISQLPDLSTLSKLTLFSCCSNQLTVLPDLPVSITHIQISKNKLSNIDNVTTLTNLKTLGCDNNNLTTLPDLSTLKSITVLTFQKNELTKIQNLAALTTLVRLNLSDNQITEFVLPPIHVLELNNCGLTGELDLLTMYNLRKLELKNNKITKIKGLSSMIHLEYLNVHENDNIDISESLTLPNLQVCVR
jgi:Leucine-rich repeat (LRR) protein